MIIDGNSYNITRPFNVNWSLNVSRELMTSGFYRVRTNVYSTDIVSTNIIVKGSYDTLKVLETYVDSNRSLSVTFEAGEKVFGSHINYSSAINCSASEIKGVNRLNFTDWIFSFKVTTTNLPLDPSVTPEIEPLLYPATYSAGKLTNGEVVNKSTYGDVYISYDNTVSINKLTFTLTEKLSAQAMRGFVEIIRGDFFELTSDWLSIKPFGEENYNHAQILDLSYSQDSYNRYKISITIQGAYYE